MFAKERKEGGEGETSYKINIHVYLYNLFDKINIYRLEIGFNHPP